MSVLKVIFILLEVLLLFNLLIFVHELGHFLAARWRGLKVERFAIWFGKPIWKKNIGGVEFCLGWIPAGGYVSLPQMAPMDMVEGKTESTAEELPPVSAWSKIIVAFAGPLFSFLLALVFALVVWGVGRPVSPSETETFIGHVARGGAAERAGLRAGDRILSIDGHPVTKFRGMGDSVHWRIVRSEGETIAIEAEREGKKLTFEVEASREKTGKWQRRGLRDIQIESKHPVIIGSVLTNSPAARAGLKVGDKIVAIDGQKIYHPRAVPDYLQANSNKVVTFTVARGDQQFDKNLRAEVPAAPPNESPLIGIDRWMAGAEMTLAHPKPVEQVVDSVNAMISTFGALLSRKSDIGAQHLGGAIKIISVYYILFQSEQGWRLALWFSVLMNVNLALLNLLPIPVLDGGHIVLAAVEAIRRKPVSVRVLQYMQTACAAALIIFMLYIAFYDLQDLLPGKGDRRPQIRFDPQPAPTPSPAPSTP